MKKGIIALTTHIAILLAVVITFGCISLTRVVADGYEKFTGELERDITLHILENDTAKKQGYLEKLLVAFNAKFAEYGINAIDANMDEYTDLEKNGPHGYGPDVLYQANDILMKYVDGKHIQPLPVEQMDCFSEIPQEAWDAYTKNVSQIKYVFGVPVNIQGPLLYYRKDLLPQDWETTYDKNNNKVPDMVENWSALYKYSQKILEESAGKKFGYMRSLYDVYFSSGYLFTYGAYVFGNGGTDTKDIGFSKGDAVKGANVVKQLATVMDRGCVDVTITSNCYSRMADGTYFATMTTPDVYSLFIKEMVIDYQRKDKSLSTEDATAKAIENLVVTDVPMLPKSGDLNDTTGEMVPTKMMGGINGYAISSYTEYPNAALAFVNFATNYDMIQTRISTLGIVPARKDLAIETGGLASIINKNLQEGNIAVMPSVRAVAQIWSPTETFFADLAEDAFREEGKKKYVTEAQMLAGLQLVDKQIYDAINTLK